MSTRRPGFPASMPHLRAATSPRASGPSAPTTRTPPSSNRSGTTQRVSTPTGLGLDSSAVRQMMVRRLMEHGIRDARVLQAMGAVPRHLFVDSALVNQAYEDTSLPIGLGQTISKPSVVARMIELLLGGSGAEAVTRGRILEIGTGCAYQASVLSLVAGEVYSMERLRGLHERAIENIRPLQLRNVHLILGDGMLGYPKGAPYAGIISAAGGDTLPQTWVEQLAVGGRIVAPTVTASGAQALYVIEKTRQGVSQMVLEGVHFVPLKSGID